MKASQAQNKESNPSVRAQKKQQGEERWVKKERMITGGTGQKENNAERILPGALEREEYFVVSTRSRVQLQVFLSLGRLIGRPAVLIPSCPSKSSTVHL